MADRIQAYAAALLAVTRTEEEQSRIEDELFSFARAFEQNDELRSTLTDKHVPATRRQQIVEDLLGSAAHDATTALISMIVGTGRARDLPAIVDALLAQRAHDEDKEVAEVRSAIELDEDQQRRLAEALSSATGKEVEVRVVVDPSVLGGLIAQVGDTVIDGSVRHRLNQLRESFARAERPGPEGQERQHSRN